VTTPDKQHALNEAGWAFIAAARNKEIEIPGPVWNNIKTLLKPAIEVYLREMLLPTEE
jgi:hypothetical protein